MIWKRKLFVVLCFVLVSLFFSVFGYNQNASAAYISRLAYGMSVSGNALTRQGPTSSGVFTLDVNSLSDYTTSLRNYRFNNIGFTLNNNLQSSYENGILLDFYVLVSDKGSASSQLNTPQFSVAGMCPSINPNMYEGRLAVYDCEVETISRETFITQYQTDYITASGTNYDELTTINYSETFFYLHYKMTVYNTSETTVSLNNFSLYGPFLQIFSNRSFENVRLTFLTSYITSGYPINQQTAEEKMNDKDDEDRANIEAQTDDTQDGADESSAQAQATGTTLMGAFSAFVSALASVHETNCNLPTFSIYGMNFSNMDLCTFDVPSGIIALATIGMVFVIVPLSFHLVRRLINIFRSFSG